MYSYALSQALHILALAAGPFIPSYETLCPGIDCSIVQYITSLSRAEACRERHERSQRRKDTCGDGMAYSGHLLSRCVRASEVWVLSRTVLMTSLVSQLSSMVGRLAI